MAKNTVEYFSARLGNGVLNNAASEATLQEVLRYYKNNSDQDDDQDDDTAESLARAAKSFGAVKKAFSSLASGLSNTVTAGRNFAGMIARGESRLSAYGKFLQDDLISKLPVVGETLGDLSGIMVQSIEALESWNDDLKQANKHGATFNYSILDFKSTALDMGLGTDELVQLIGNNADKLVGIGGGTITVGMKRLSNLSARLFMDSDEVSTILDRWGYNTYQQNEMLLDYYFTTGRQKDMQRRDLEVTAHEFLMYAGQLDTYQKITGMGREQRLQAAAAAANDISYKLKVAKLLPHQQAKMEMALNGFAMIFGEQGAELFKSRTLGVQTIDDVATNLQIALGPEFERSMDEVIKMAKTTTDPAVFEKYVNETLGRQLTNSQQAIKRLEPLLKSAVAGNERAKLMVKALTPSIEFIIKQGGMSKDMQGQFVKMIEAAKKEQNKTDAFTDVLRKFERAVLRVYRSFWKTLFPVFKELANEFKIAMVPNMIRDFTKYLKELATDAIPYVKNFFTNLNSEEGQRYMGIMFKSMFSALLDYSNAYIREALYSSLGVERAAEWLSKFGIGPSTKRMKERAARSYEQGQEAFKAVISPPGTPMKEVSGSEDILITPPKGRPFYIRGFDVDSRGRFKSYSNPNDHPEAYDPVTDPEAIQMILALREERAGKGTKPDYDPANFGGLSLLQRDALLFHFREKGAGRRRTPFGAINALSNPGEFGKSGQNTRNLIDEFLKKQEVQDRIKQLREKYPSTYVGMRTGTLGTMGGLFANFRSGTPATLHGKEAVVSPTQLKKVMDASAQISIKDVVNRLNTNINMLIAVAKADINVERSKLRAMT